MMEILDLEISEDIDHGNYLYLDHTEVHGIISLSIGL